MEGAAGENASKSFSIFGIVVHYYFRAIGKVLVRLAIRLEFFTV